MTSLHKLIEAASSNKVARSIGMDRALPDFSKLMHNRLQLAKNAVCFDMGDAEVFSGMPIELDMLILPFPVTWFEFKWLTADDSAPFTVGILASSASGTQRISAHDVFTHAGGKAGSQGCTWAYMGHCEYSWNEAGSGAVCYPKETVLPLENVSQILHVYLTALNCCNVKRVRTEPSERLQRARAAKGKIPLFSYWTLELDLQKQGDRDVDLGGTHASPRLHLRRGHVKRSKLSGKRWWVQAHLVGSKQSGLVHKDYRTVH